MPFAILKVDSINTMHLQCNVDKFIKYSLVKYLQKSDFFSNSINMYKSNQNTEKEFCKNLYFLSEELFRTAVIKHKTLFDDTFYNKHISEGEMIYIFDPKTLKKIDPTNNDNDETINKGMHKIRKCKLEIICSIFKMDNKKSKLLLS